MRFREGRETLPGRKNAPSDGNIPEEAFGDVESHLRPMADNLPALIAYIDKEEHYRFVNKAYEKYGYDPRKMIGRKVRDVIGEAIYGALSGYIRTALSGEKAQYEAVLPAADGSKRYISGSYVPHFDAGGKVLGFFVLALDITERKAAEDSIRAYQQELRSLMYELSASEERERKKIAEELHDYIGQNLALTKLRLAAIRESAPEIAGSLSDVIALVEETIGYSRSLMHEISPPVLHELGLRAAIEWLAEQMRDRHGVKISLETYGPLNRVDADLSALVFKALRELLINVVKHSSASTAKVTVGVERGRLCLTVSDDGVGFDVLEVKKHSVETRHFGLFSINERVKHLGGTFEAKSSFGRGAQIEIIIPLSGAAWE